MNSKDAPPGNNDPARPRAAAATSEPARTIVELSGPPPFAPQSLAPQSLAPQSLAPQSSALQAKASAPRASDGTSLLPTTSSDPLLQSAGPDRRDASTTRQRIANGLPPQPPPAGFARAAARPGQPGSGPAKGMDALTPTAATLLRTGPNSSAARGAAGLNPPPPAPTSANAKPDLPVPDRKNSGRLGTTPNLPMPASGRSQPARRRGWWSVQAGQNRPGGRTDSRARSVAHRSWTRNALHRAARAPPWSQIT